MNFVWQKGRPLRIKSPQDLSRTGPCPWCMKLGAIPPASTETVHRIMVANRGKNTTIERKLRRALLAAGAPRGRAHFRVGPTRVDLAFPSQRVAVQIHGCFWHHCPTCNLPIPRTNRAYWRRKFAINQARDVRSRREIRRAGWRLIEIWEHQIDDDFGSCVGRIIRALNHQANALAVNRSASALSSDLTGNGPKAPIDRSL
jgi:DNA mismatch endonuclease, patch repair protein